VRDLFRAGPGRLHASQGGAVRGQKSEVSAAAGCADRSRVEGGRLREEKILNFANDGPHSASVIRAETLEDAPLTAPLDCSPFPRGAGRRPEGFFLPKFHTSPASGPGRTPTPRMELELAFRQRTRRPHPRRLEGPDRFSSASMVRGFVVTRTFGQPGGMNCTWR